jgi:Alginate lyase
MGLGSVWFGSNRKRRSPMTEQERQDKLTRREMLRLSAAGMAALQGTALFAPAGTHAAPPSLPTTAESQLYSTLLKTWCDGLIARQIVAMRDPAFYGGLLCPACVLIHGRCGDAVYPLLKMAHSTGDEKYLRAAKLIHEWSEAQVSRPEGSWINDVTLSQWQGITVFRAVALAEALTHHAEVLDSGTRRAWIARLAAAAKFLDGFISMETGNVNYPAAATLAFVLCGQVLREPRYIDRARKLAHQVMDQFTSDGFLFGEGHPLDGISPKGCRSVDLGYNIEESLPSLALYSQLTGDRIVEQQVVSALKTHLEFQFPDGGWDNSWGTRNYKWSWWGSRTSDGCHPGFLLMAEHDPRFREAARRNLELMANCTHERLLYGGPDYKDHGDLPCIHHTFTHAKALAAVLDRCSFPAEPARPAIPRAEPYGLRSFPTVGTHLAAIDQWRATVTEYDWEYQEHPASGFGGHVSGGALSALYHMALGPILTASMTHYEMIEISNQQQERAAPHMPLTPRIECTAGDTYTSLNDYKASLSATRTGVGVVFVVHGRLMSNAHKPMEGDGLLYEATWTIDESGVELRARVRGQLPASASLQFIVPVIARQSERVEQASPQSVHISKSKGLLIVSVDANHHFEPIPHERTFNLVPGFEAVPLIVAIQPGNEVAVRMEAGGA